MRQTLDENDKRWAESFKDLVMLDLLNEDERNLFFCLREIYEAHEEPAMTPDEYSAFWACWYYSTDSGRRVKLLNSGAFFKGLDADPAYIKPRDPFAQE